MNPKDLVGAKKAPLGVVPPALVIAAAPAMQVGALKYGAFNWRQQPVQAMTYVEAVQRHLSAWVDGQDEAEDTGISHIGHAIAGLGILADAIASGNLLDNRPPRGPAADMLRAQDRSVSPAAPEPERRPFVGYGGTGDWRTRSDWENKVYGRLPRECDWVNSGQHDQWCKQKAQADVPFRVEYNGIDLSSGQDVTVVAEFGGELPIGWSIVQTCAECSTPFGNHRLDCSQWQS